MKIGITGLVIPTEWTYAETLANIRKDGYDALELALRDDGYFSLTTSDAEAAALATAACCSAIGS